ncbi:MAG: hypothetical protein SFV15_20235 [Polyangiaceae bacterium]|nr:hypothetical protein [Polyangiaceae bacterium]
MIHRLSNLQAIARLGIIGCLFTACETNIPGPPSETIIYETYPRRPNIQSNIPGASGVGGNAGAPGSPASGGPGGGSSVQGVCTPARATEAEKVPARSSVTSPDAQAKPQPIFVDTLWNKYQSVGQCYVCHTTQSLGGWNVTRETFPAKMNTAAVDRMLSDDLALVMPKPPLGKRVSERSPDDPILQYANELKQWIAAGSPPDLFYPPMPVDPKKAYVLSETLGKSLTNIGNCIPEASLVGTNRDAAAKLDQMFEKATELPKRLEETDLISLDSEILAQQGVIAFAPAYPLWADNAKKLRHVRVPVGKSIAYNPTTKLFDIPANTRFYKTFFKQVIDLTGKVSFRKIETRIIVSRPDTKAPDGTSQVNALYGTYKWLNDDESEAVLQEARRNDGSVFADELITYPTDEVKAAPILAGDSPDVVKELKKQGLLRHYAIPGKERCDQCHEGAPDGSFVLGFTPLQIARRPLGEGGTIEAPSEDELTQLQRLIDYGVVTGIDASGREAKLEDSQGSRKPRNKYELEAQGYFLGNCAHCHNPRGFPSTNFPELASVLNFWPDAESGGIFQFPLDRVSPRTKRYGRLRQADPDAQFDIPYITPSLTEMSAKFESESNAITQRKMILPGLAGGSKPPRSVPFLRANGQTIPDNEKEPVDAPWRSLIYRNVDTPFTYAEGKAIFTHMPLHTSGFDCRLPQIAGNWMVSIPAHLQLEGRRISEARNEAPVKVTAVGWMVPCETPLLDYFDNGTNPGIIPTGWQLLSPAPGTTDKHNCEYCVGGWCIDPEIKDFGMKTQPFVEVLPGAGRKTNHYTQRGGGSYEDAVAEAEERLKIYQAGERYNWCPDTTDILDPEVGTTDAQGKTIVVPREPNPSPQFALGVPLRPHFIPTDTTQVPGPWNPRRADWKKVLSLDPFAPLPSGFAIGVSCEPGITCITEEELGVLKLLKSVQLTPELRAFALQTFPYGTWKENPECDFSTVPTIDAFAQNADKWQWTQEVQVDRRNKPVFEQTPGGVVFEMICSNCHGQKADSNGKLADRIVEMTGGIARVANLRDGLFGPVDLPGKYRNDVLGVDAGAWGLSVDDVAGRYVAWMGLGGTKVNLPPSILQLVGAKPVLGMQRQLTLPAGSPNMLQVAMELCRQVLPGQSTRFNPERGHFVTEGPVDWGLFDSNGDAEMWQRLCGFDNLPPVRAIHVVSGGGTLSFDYQTVNLYDRAAYPSSAPVGTHDAQVVSGVSASNRLPWCLRAGTNTTDEALQAYADSHPIGGKPLPICPPQMFQDISVMGGATVSPIWTEERITSWARRGAINAGLAVFAYVDAVARGTALPKPGYDQCESLSK